VRSAVGVDSRTLAADAAELTMDMPRFALRDVDASLLRVRSAGVFLQADNRRPDLTDPAVDIALYEPDARFALSMIDGSWFTTSFVLASRPGLPVFVTNYSLDRRDGVTTYGTTVLNVVDVMAAQMSRQNGAFANGEGNNGNGAPLLPTHLLPPMPPRPVLVSPPPGSPPPGLAPRPDDEAVIIVAAE